MRKLLMFAAIVAASAFITSPAVASQTIHVNGGGTGAIGGVPFSQFGLGVTVFPDGEVNGHFNCLMAGRTAFPGFEPLMAVRGQIYWASVSPATGEAQLLGQGTLNLGPNGRMPATFHVRLREGGPGVGKFQLTVLKPPFPVPEETVFSGHITIH